MRISALFKRRLSIEDLRKINQNFTVLFGGKSTMYILTSKMIVIDIPIKDGNEPYVDIAKYVAELEHLMLSFE